MDKAIQGLEHVGRKRIMCERAQSLSAHSDPALSAVTCYKSSEKLQEWSLFKQNEVLRGSDKYDFVGMLSER